MILGKTQGLKELKFFTGGILTRRQYDPPIVYWRTGAEVDFVGKPIMGKIEEVIGS